MRQEVEVWQRYGRFLIGALVLLLIVGLGVVYYQHRTKNQSLEAYRLYQGLMSLQKERQLTDAQAQAKRLKDGYAKTPYASLAGLWLAKVQVEAQDFTAARAELEWVIKSTDSPAMRQLTRLRLAKVWIALQDLEQALAVLDHKVSPAFVTLYEEQKGDIYVLQNKLDEARAAYQAALAAANNVPLPWIEIKLANLGASAPVPAGKPQGAS